MKVTLRIPAPEAECGYKEIEIDIAEEELAKLAEPQKPSKPTGYERVSKGEQYYYNAGNGSMDWFEDNVDKIDANYYDNANYYSSELVAENNARADKLMRQLRRFAVKHREKGVDFGDGITAKWYLGFDCNESQLFIDKCYVCREFGVIYFDSKEAVKAALEAFHNELIWYFTEYKDSL